MAQKIALSWAMTRNRVIGNAGWLPWDLPDELDYFRRITKAKPVIMGRRTFEATGRPMPGRLNVVLSRGGFTAAGVSVAADLDEALAIAGQDPADTCFVIGGAQPYAEALPRADILYATFVDAELDGDTSFPAFDFSGWRVIDSVHHGVDDQHAYPFDMNTYVRQD